MRGRSEPLHIAVDEYSRLLFKEATDGVFVSNVDGVYLEVNRSGHHMLGYADGELIGKPISDVILDHDVPRLHATIAAVGRGDTQTQAWPMVRKDGSIVQLEVSVQMLSNRTVLAVVRDLGGRAEYEHKIQASEAKLRSILHTAPDVIMTVDRKGRILFINRTLPPHTVEHVVGTSCYDYVVPAARARVRRAIEHVFTTRDFDAYEVEGATDPAGNLRWSSVRVGPLIQGDEVVAATLCATDVTERKREEARTRELLERLAKIARQVPGLVFQYQLRADGGSCMPYASERIREIFRVSPEDVREDSSKLFEILHPDDHASVRDAIGRSAATLEAWQQEYRVRFADDDVRWLFVSALPERQADGSTLWHGFITDVTEHKRAEQARAKLEEQLQQAQKMESIGQLAGGVAHDFNNLLTTVGAFVELAQEELPPEAQVRDYLEGVLAATARGAALTQQLLAFARKKIVQPQEADLNAIIGRMAQMIGRLVGEHIEFALELSARLGSVKVDVGSMEQVIMNLIVNARDAMPNGGKLTLQTQNVVFDARETALHPDIAAGAYVLLAVTDTGTGMSSDVKARLFEPFFTTKPPGAGTGLGLAMCHGLVKQAGGTISVHSELDVGTTFYVYLPRQLEAPLPLKHEAATTTISTGHETVLLVEDEPMILRVARAALERRGYRVLCANDGLEALELVHATPEPIALLVTDVVMPKLGGSELAARLSQLRPGIKVLYTSGYAENALATQGVLPARVNFIQKPYALATLSQRVREVLDEPES
jgi:two-component system, cell cycle sensor histidine kinase and response regulator CckA